jgi:SAM-dependent methyltransferase
MTLTPDARARNAQYWRQFYASHNLRHDPSPFARWCLEQHLAGRAGVLELGCGNGRDSFTLARHGLPVLAVDGCEVAIEDNVRYAAQLQQAQLPRFAALDFSQLQALGPAQLQGIDTIYTRFVLHAVPEELEDTMLAFCQGFPTGTLMLHEFRTIRDPLMQQGAVLSANERVTDHYRRFLDPVALRAKLARAGWDEVDFVEGHGLAVYGTDDPWVARVVARRAR